MLRARTAPKAEPELVAPVRRAILPVFKFGVELPGDQVAQELGVSGKDQIRAVKRTLGGMTRKSWMCRRPRKVRCTR